jgi:hypothetical protein
MSKKTHSQSQQAFYRENRSESQNDWLRRVNDFCNVQGIVIREVLLRGQGLRVSGNDDQMMLFKLTFK